jgi:hypothetical protein
VTKPFARALLRVAEKGPEGRETAAFDVSAALGGTPRVWTEGELLLEGVSVGLDLDYEHSGRVLTVCVGKGADYPEVAKWLQALNQKSGGQAKLRERDVESYAHFPRMLCAILGGGEIQCTVRGERVVVGGKANVLKATKAMFGETSMKSVAGYFGVRLSERTRRM